MGLGGSTKGAWQNSITVRVRAQPSGFAPFFWSSHSNKKEQGKTPQKMKQNSFHFWHGVGKRKRVHFLRFAIDFYLQHWKLSKRLPCTLNGLKTSIELLSTALHQPSSALVFLTMKKLNERFLTSVHSRKAYVATAPNGITNWWHKGTKRGVCYYYTRFIRP